MDDVKVDAPGGRFVVWHRPARGTSPTAVLVHGLSGNSRWWSRVIDDLPGDIGVVALDVRGRGLSIDAPPPYDLTTISDDIGRALDRLGLPTAIVAGYSMGGWVAALFGHREPDRVDRLVLVDGGIPLPVERGMEPEEIIDALVGPSLARFEMEFVSRQAFIDYWKSHPAFREHWDDAMEPALAHELVVENGMLRVRANPEAISVGAREITVGAAPNEAAKRLEVPTHLMVAERGTADQLPGMIPLEIAEDAAKANPNITIQYLAGVNHYTVVLGNGCGPVASAIATG
ncbi:MAG TPA: alpha/beta hydrolase [Acidimicrobiia bacterium]|nr:alpha/beta hydrolase [Acidimicrobiia bacterium]